MFASRNFCSPKAGPYLKGLGGWNGKHGVAERGFKLVKDGLSQTRRNVADDAGHGPTNRVLGILGPDDSLLTVSNWGDNDLGSWCTSVMRSDVSG